MSTSNFRIPHDRHGNLVKTPEEKEKDRVKRITEAPTQIIDMDDKPILSPGGKFMIGILILFAAAGIVYWISAFIASSK